MSGTPDIGDVNRAPAPVLAQMDMLADGRWHTFRAVIETGAAAAADEHSCDSERVLDVSSRAAAAARANVKASQSALTTSIRRGHLTREGDRVRMFEPVAVAWRNARGLDIAKVNTFGGIVEAEGWLYAPLRRRDVIFFRTSIDISVSGLRTALARAHPGTGVSSNGEGLIRVVCDDSRCVKTSIESYCSENGSATRNLRVTAGARRREVSALPDRFFADLLRFYADRVAPVVIGKRNVFVAARLPSDNDDLRQQATIWTMEAIERFDDTLGVPFLAYLHTQIGRHMNDLGRTSWGRTAVDAERGYRQLAEEYASIHGREPSDRELAMWAGIELEQVTSQRLIVEKINNVRRPHVVDETTVVPADETVEQRLVAEEGETELSASLTATAIGGSAESLVAWFALCQSTWGSTRADRVAEVFGVEPDDLRDAITQATVEMREHLRRAEFVA